MLRICGPVLLVALLGMAAASSARQERAATQSAVSQEAVARALGALNATDPADRESARRQLLSLRTSDLPVVVEAVKQLPEEAARSAVTVLTLRDVLLHAHLRSARLGLIAQRQGSSVPPGPFMGINVGGGTWSDQSTGKNGVLVRTTIPGYIAYEIFEEGDLLVGIRSESGLQPLANFQELRSALVGLEPGDPVEFIVLRGGRVLRLSFHLDDNTVRDEYDEQWIRAQAEARRQAEAFWDDQLAPLLKPQATARTE